MYACELSSIPCFVFIFCRRSIVRSFIRSWLPWLLMRRDYTYFGNAIPFYVLVLALVFRLLVPRPHCIASVAPSSTLSSSRCRHYRMLHAYEIVALNVHQECLAKLRTHTHIHHKALPPHTILISQNYTKRFDTYLTHSSRQLYNLEMKR